MAIRLVDMSAIANTCRVTILIKAVPRASKKYGETVCCAGVTEDGKWKRLYPVRFRQLAGDSQFRRWDWVTFRYRQPTDDLRSESCHVFEDTIIVEGSVESNRRSEFIDRLIVPSAAAAATNNQSLGLIRPKNTRFIFKKRRTVQFGLRKSFFEKQGDKHLFLIPN